MTDPRLDPRKARPRPVRTQVQRLEPESVPERTRRLRQLMRTARGLGRPTR